MAKSKVTPAPPGPQEAQAARTIPLSEIAITWYRGAHFVGEKDDTPVVISGRQLAQVLSWLANERPGVFGEKPSREDVWTAGEIGLELEGLGEILRGLGEADLEIIPANTPSIFCALSTVTKGLAMRLAAVDDGETESKQATVTIGAPAPKAEAS
jgi:hypothetical protein